LLRALIATSPHCYEPSLLRALFVSAFYVSGLFVGGPLRYPLYSSRDEISLECFSYRVAKNTFSNGLEDFMTSVFELRHKRA